MTVVQDIIVSGQRWADRVKYQYDTGELLAYANEGLKELYGILCSTYEDWNVLDYNFSLVGGSYQGNQLQVGPNTTLPDFYQPRAMMVVVSGGPTPFLTIPRLPSLNEQNLYSFPNIVPLFGAVPTYWNLIGNVIQIVPLTVGPYNYLLKYVPALPTFGDTSQPVDKYWLSLNGWDTYASLYVGERLALKEESYDTAQMLAQKRTELKQRILQEAKPRDISEPRQIVDMKRVRATRSGWGWNGGGAPGWGWGGTGDGNW